MMEEEGKTESWGRSGSCTGEMMGNQTQQLEERCVQQKASQNAKP